MQFINLADWWPTRGAAPADLARFWHEQVLWNPAGLIHFFRFSNVCSSGYCTGSAHPEVVAFLGQQVTRKGRESIYFQVSFKSILVVSLFHHHCLTVSCICQCRNGPKGNLKEGIVPLQSRQIICYLDKAWCLNHKRVELFLTFRKNLRQQTSKPFVLT